MTLSQINSWLQAPKPLSIEESEDLERSIRHYPYLTPLKLIRAAAGETALPANRWTEVNPVVAASLRQALLECDRSPVVPPIPDAAPAAEAMPPAPDVYVAESEPLVADIPESPTAPVSETEAKAVEPAEEPIILPFSSEDYFRQQGVEVSSELGELPTSPEETLTRNPESAENPLMVMMSFSDWLMHFKQRSQKEKEEDEEKRALKSHWQREKLAAALEDEEDEIPEGVFQMAVDSISREDNPASESLAEVLVKQGKTEAAIDMFRRLQLRNPAKSGYFAARIDALQKGA